MSTKKLVPVEDMARDIDLIVSWKQRHFSHELPPSLDGSMGLNRRRDGQHEIIPCHNIEGNNDGAAIIAWLRRKNNPLTRDSYRKEAMRLLAWAILIRNKSLSDLMIDDMEAYDDFLREIPSQWRSKRPEPFRKRDGSLNPKWTPFSGKGLSTNSRLQTFTILNALFSWLLNVGYLHTNPVELMPERRDYIKPGDEEEIIRQSLFETRYISPDEKKYLWEAAIEQRPLVRWLIALLRYTGMRIEEVATHRMSNFYEEDGLWYLQVLGKGTKLRTVSVLPSLVDELMRFRVSQNWAGLPSPHDDEERHRPLIPGRKGKAMTKRNLLALFKKVAAEAADRMEPVDKKTSRHLRASSPHWFRHSFITDLLENGAEISDVQDTVGHSRYETTARYRHKDYKSVHRRISDFDDIL